MLCRVGREGEARRGPAMSDADRFLSHVDMSCRAIAESIGRKHAPVYDVISGKTWRHVQ